MASRELVVGALFGLLLLAFADPFMVRMPTPLFYCVSAVFVALAALFVGLILREQPRDEREQAHIRTAGRVGYMVGTVLLTLGILVESMLDHTVDPWLLAGLGALISWQTRNVRLPRASRQVRCTCTTLRAILTI